MIAIDTIEYKIEWAGPITDSINLLWEVSFFLINVEWNCVATFIPL